MIMDTLLYQRRTRNYAETVRANVSRDWSWEGFPSVLGRVVIPKEKFDVLL